MRSFITHLLVVLVIAAAGAVLWSAGAAEQRLAGAERTLVTLRYERAVEEFDAAAEAGPIRRVLAGLMGQTAGAEERELAEYWLGDYEQFLKTDDPTMRLVAANAAYRAMRTRGGSRQEVQTRLDEIIKRYAAVLREQPDNEDAAFNYEFAVRLRGSVSATRNAIPAADLDELGLTVHGTQGGPPDDSDAKKFKMIVPMQPDERLEAEEAGRGGRKVRKG